MMTWDELITLSKEGADIANHSWAHEHLIRALENESQAVASAGKANILDTEKPF